MFTTLNLGLFVFNSYLAKKNYERGHYKLAMFGSFCAGIALVVMTFSLTS